MRSPQRTFNVSGLRWSVRLARYVWQHSGLLPSRSGVRGSGRGRLVVLRNELGCAGKGREAESIEGFVRGGFAFLFIEFDGFEFLVPAGWRSRCRSNHASAKKATENGV